MLWNWAFQGEDRRYIHEWFRGLPVGKSRTLVLQLGEKAEVTTSVTAKRLKDDSLIIVAYNSTLRPSPYAKASGDKLSFLSPVAST